jgi:acetoacetyl-[acyl-carrier protein] synthase
VARLPVIVGFGGVNPAGRLSLHHAYRRLVIDALEQRTQDETYRSLAQLMNLEDAESAGARQYMRDHTLIRRIELFDPDAIYWQRNATLASAGDAMRFRIAKRHLPDQIPTGWTITDDGARDVLVTVDAALDVLLPDARTSRVTSAGQLPSGFDPAALYQSRNHPRGLQIAVYGASDAVGSLGIDWSTLRRRVAPDQFAVYAGSAMGQLDTNGFGGLLQAGLNGKRTTSKQTALGMSEMAGDFVNAYVLGTAGHTGTAIGACATWLYNLRLGVEDIVHGRARVAIVGNSEAPITPEVIEGFRTMGALAEDEALMALDGRTDQPDNRRACRPFSDNCGFTLGESSVFAILMDDALALELGANILGAAAGVYVNADGFKKSIPGPGIGNYLTMAKAMALARAIVGDSALKQRSCVQAHGTGTPQNRVTESHILNELAKTFGIDQWIVAAVKAYVGHSLGPASGDQLAAVLGAWQYGLVPGIATIDHVAADVHASNLRIESEHVEIDPAAMDVTFVNSKGFGGNNATGIFLSPSVTRRMLERRHGKAELRDYDRRNEAVATATRDYDARMTRGELKPIYQFGEGVLEGQDLGIDSTAIRVPGYEQPLDLQIPNPFTDMTD